MSFDFDYCAIQSHNRLRLLQPQIEERGLYKSGPAYLILCPDLTSATKADDGTPLIKWFHENKQMLTPVTLVPTLPAGATRMRELTPIEMAACTGDTHTLRDVYADLAVELPLDFPSFYVQDGTGSITIVVSRDLNEEEDRRLRDTLERLRLAAQWSIATSSIPLKKADEFTRSPQGDMDLLPARSSKARGMASELSSLVRSDEESWLEHRSSLSNPSANSTTYLPSGFTSKKARCLIDATAFPVTDIRNHLSIYQRVAIVMPLEGSLKRFYSTANVTEDELVQLAQMGRLEFVCPQPIDRYQRRLLERISAEAPASLFLSRRLALATAAECRRRVPLLYPGLTMQERASLLRGLLRAADSIQEAKHRAMAQALMRDFGRIWGTAEALLHRRGAMANSALGIAMPASRLFQAADLPDRTMEFMAAAMTVEWAAALGAAVQPVEAESFSARASTEFFANLYSGLQQDVLPRCAPAHNVRLSEIFAIGRDVPVVDFAKSFTSGEIDRMRAYILGIARHRYREDEARAVTDAFNKEVERYARDSKRIERWDLAGLILTGAGFTASKELGTGAGVVSLGVWVFSRIRKLIEEGRISEPRIVEWVDTTAAELYKTSSDAILVHRLQQRLKG